MAAYAPAVLQNNLCCAFEFLCIKYRPLPLQDDFGSLNHCHNQVILDECITMYRICASHHDLECSSLRKYPVSRT